jgi:hypothetical protein
VRILFNCTYLFSDGRLPGRTVRTLRHARAAKVGTIKQK